jgi:hypothetical protein
MDAFTTPNGPPEAPRNLDAVTLSTSSIRLSWAPGRSGNQDSYILQRKSEQSDWEQIGGELARETVSYTDTGLRESNWYWYKILGGNEIGPSPYSDIDSTQTWSVIVLADGFENHPTGSPPQAPWEVTDRGGSTTRVTDVLAHNGIKSVMLQDQNPNQIDSASTYVRTATRQVSIGQIRTWLYIAPNGYWATLGFDENDYITYQIQFNPNATFYIRNGSLWPMEAIGHTYPQGEWFELVIDFNTNTGVYNVSFDETLHVRGAGLQRQALHAGNNGVMYLTYRNTVIDYVYLDDFEIRDTADEQQGLISAPFLPAGGIGDAKVSDVIWVEEARP